MICHFFCIKFWIQMFGVKSLLSCEIFKTPNISKIQNLWNFGFERVWTERVLFSQISKWFLVPFKGGVSYVLGACELVVGRCTCRLLFQWATRTTMWDMGPKKSKAHMGHLVQLKESMCQSHGLGFLILTILQHIALDASHSFEFWTFKTHVEWMQFGVYCWLGLLWLWKDVVLWFGPTFWQMFTMCSCEL